MGNTQAKRAEQENDKPLEKPLEKMTDEELLAAVEKDTDIFFEHRYTREVFGKYSKPLTLYIHRCSMKSTECSMDKLYTLLDKYNTPYTINLPDWGKFCVKFIRVPVSTKSVEAQ